MDIVDQIEDVASGHENGIKYGSDVVADFIGGKTDGAYAVQVDRAQGFLTGHRGS